jgi:hypothetical protein
MIIFSVTWQLYFHIFQYLWSIIFIYSWGKPVIIMMTYLVTFSTPSSPLIQVHVLYIKNVIRANHMISLITSSTTTDPWHFVTFWLKPSSESKKKFGLLTIKLHSLFQIYRCQICMFLCIFSLCSFFLIYKCVNILKCLKLRICHTWFEWLKTKTTSYLIIWLV